MQIPVVRYKRFSTIRQRKGDSARRQDEAINAFLAQDPNRVLFESFDDEGVSAFTGKNRERGELARCMQMVRAGAFPRGTILAIESQDRLSRADVMTALSVFSEILKAGLLICTLSDGRFYSSEIIKENVGELLIVVVAMSRAYEESLLKSKRLGDAWAEKRSKAGEKILTSKGPRWLRISADGTDWEIIEEIAAIIRRIFQELADGDGIETVTRRLNQEGVPTLGGGKLWHSSTVHKIVRSQYVLGRYQPHKMQHFEENGMRVSRRVPDGPVRENYYKAIISEDLWLRAQGALTERQSAPPTKRVGNGRTGNANNIFNDVAICAVCGGRMIIRDGGGRKKYAVLKCTTAHRGGNCVSKALISYWKFQTSFLDWVAEIKPQPAGNGRAGEIEQALAAREIARRDLKTRIDGLLDLAESRRESVLARLDEREAELRNLEIEIGGLHRQLQKAQGRASPKDQQRLMADLRAALPDSIEARLRMRRLVREFVDMMRVEADGTVVVLLGGGLVGYQFDPGAVAPRKYEYRPPIIKGRLSSHFFLIAGTEKERADRKRKFERLMAD